MSQVSVVRPQAQLAAVDLAAVSQKVRGDLGALSQQHQQHAGSHGIQSARVAYLALAQALERREAAGRRGARRLVEHQDAVQLGQRRRFACGDGSLFGHTQQIMIASLRHEVKSAGIWRQAIACCGPKVKRFMGTRQRRIRSRYPVLLRTGRDDGAAPRTSRHTGTAPEQGLPSKKWPAGKHPTGRPLFSENRLRA